MSYRYGILVLTFFILLFYGNIVSTQAEELKRSQVVSSVTKEERLKIIKEKIRKTIEKRNKEKLLKERKQKIREKILKLNALRKANTAELSSAEEKIQYPKTLDISNKLKYKRIQEKSLSCELSATSDILSHLKGKKFSEDYVIHLVDKSKYNQLPVEENGKTIWGNPNAGYVGNIHTTPSGKKATQSGMTGYGVLEKPIDNIYKKYNFKTKVITQKNYKSNYSQKQHLTEVLTTLTQGNMVQLWGDYCTDPQYEDTENKNTCRYFASERKLHWYYRENGNLIKHTGLAGEHAFYLLGYKGGVENPTDIIVWDTKTGKHIYPIKEWLRKWEAMQYRSIIIYKN